MKMSEGFERQRQRSSRPKDPESRMRICIAVLPVLITSIVGTVLGITIQSPSQPERTLNITAELVTIDRQGSIVPVETSRPSIAGIWYSAASGQLSELADFKLGGGQRFRISVAAEEIGDERSLIRLVVEEFPDGRVLKDEEVPLQTSKKQEILVAVADSTVDRTTLAVRLVPALERTEAAPDYPGNVEEFGTNNGLYIVDSTDLRARGLSGFVGVTGSTDAVLALVIDDPAYGRFTLSYRPFAGAVRAGYIEDRRLVFNWDDHQFELISVENPLLPEGRWNLFVKREESSRSRAGVSGVSLRALRVR